MRLFRKHPVSTATVPIIHFIIMLSFIFILSGCGGSDDSSSNSDNNSNIVYAANIFPSKVMTGRTVSGFRLTTNHDLPNLNDPLNTHTVEVYYDNQSVSDIQMIDLRNLAVGALVDGSIPGYFPFKVAVDGKILYTTQIEVYAPELAQNPFNTITGYFVSSGSPGYSVLADLNHDGYKDVICLENYKLHILYGSSTGVLKYQKSIELSFLGGMISSGDLNNDGEEDLLLSYLDSQMHYKVLYNNGNMNFSQGPSLTITGFPKYPISLEDMNGDGRKDLVFPISDPDGIYLAINQGSSFATPIKIAETYRYLSITDINNDGSKDILYFTDDTDPNRYRLGLLLNRGDGSFITDSIPSLNYSSGISASITPIDYDKDGLPDLAIQTGTYPNITLSIYHNSGNASFSFATSTTLVSSDWSTLFSFITGDFDNDGNPDLVGIKPDALIYLWGSGNGSFVSQSINGITSNYLVSGDINADGIADILIPKSLTISVILGRKDRKIPSPTVITSGGRISTADVDGDGCLDMLLSTGYQSGLLGALYLNDGTGNFYLVNAAIPSSAMVIADLNGDGKAELIGADEEHVYIWPGTGDANFAANPTTINESLNPSSMQIRDMDKDGHLDIIAVGGNYSGMILYTQTDFTADPVRLNFYPYFLIDDFNNDGYPDIVGSNTTYLGGINRTFAEVTDHFSMSLGYINQPNRLTSADFNKDGYLDLAIADDELIDIYYGRGDGSFYSQSLLCAETSVEGVTAGDYNNDGWPDIVVSSAQTGHLVVYINDHQKRFLRAYADIGITGRHLITADFNKDSLPDLAATDYNNIAIVSHN